MIHYSADEARGTCGEGDGLVGVASTARATTPRLRGVGTLLRAVGLLSFGVTSILGLLLAFLGRGLVCFLFEAQLMGGGRRQSLCVLSMVGVRRSPCSTTGRGA